MDLLGPWPKAEHENQIVLVITDRISKLTRCIALCMTTEAVVVNAFLEYRIYVYGALQHVHTDNCPQFSAKLFHAVYALLGISHSLTTS